MANATGTSGNRFIYFLVGVVVAGIVGYGIYYFTEGPGGHKADLEISVSDNGIEVDGN